MFALASVWFVQFFFPFHSLSLYLSLVFFSIIYIIFAENIHANIKFVLQIKFNGQSIKPTVNCEFKREWMMVFVEKEQTNKHTGEKERERERRTSTLFHIHKHCNRTFFVQKRRKNTTTEKYSADMPQRKCIQFIWLNTEQVSSVNWFIFACKLVNLNLFIKHIVCSCAEKRKSHATAVQQRLSIRRTRIVS